MSKRLGHLFQIIALISISAIYPRVAGQAIPPNIQYMQRGYNIYFGNPLPSAGTLVDPGFGDIIFDFVKSTSSDSEDEFADQVYLAPEGVLITVGQDCSVESDASELDSMEDYASLLSLQASVQGSFDIASFSASGEYQKVQDVLSSSQSAAYTMSGTCTVYEATMQSLSPLSKPFKADVMSINASDPTSYYSFFQKYGTHYVSDITMGAKVSMIRTFTASSLQSLQSQNISIQAAAQASFGLNFGLSGAYSNENSEANAFAQSASYSDLTTIACEPPSNISSWYSAIKNPLPISYKLSSISGLFTISNFDNDTDATLFGQIADNLPAALENYYSYLETINATSITPSQSTNASSTVTLGSCRLCAQTCGGDYTVDNGVFGLNGQSPSDFATFEDGCGGGSLSEGNSFDNGVHLCCLPEVPNVVEGSVKLCSSCGGDFPRAIGDFGIASAGWVETYGEACAGDLQPETASDARITVCGALPTPCMFCILCGGHFPEVVGSFSPQLIPSEINHFGGPAMGCQSVSSSGAQNANEVLTQVGFNLCCAAANTQVNVLTS